MNPFSYPKVRHTRTQTPKVYANHRAYKPYLQLEFSAKCVYCGIPDGMKEYSSFGVDHYRPQKHFPALATTYSNLFYCCSHCNTAKGTYWPNSSREQTHFIPNPCDHVMFSHVRYKGGEVISRTDAGLTAIEVLDLNDPVAIEYRESILHLIEIQEAEIQRIERNIEKLKSKAKSGVMTHLKAFTGIAEFQKRLTIAKQVLGRLDGSIPAPLSKSATPVPIP